MIKVLKFGGTSVGSAKNMKMVADIVTSEKATVTVLSAMSGTTDSLVRISSLSTQANKRSEIAETIDMLREKYSTCINQLLDFHKKEALAKMESVLELISNESDNFKEYTSERLILSQGELLTSAIFAMYMQEIGRKAVLLNAPDFMRTDEDQKVDTALLEKKINELVDDKETFYITQGFICTNHRGEIDNLGRGGSDYSAALIGGALNADEVQVWTDIDGMHNNDPRVVEGTYPIHKMSFDEAAELAYFGAKILHPATIQPCKDKDIPVFLKNTMDPAAEGTKISDEDDETRIFHAVAAKDNITVIRIYSTRMLMAYGFLRRVFEVFEKYRTPIDMITTAEVSVSLTVDNTSHLDEIEKELASFGKIEVEQDNTIVCLVGNLEHSQKGLAATIMNSIHGIPLKMISYGASHRSIAMLVDTKYKKEMMQSMNDKLFGKENHA